MDGNGRAAKLKRLPHHSSGVEQGRRMSSSDSRHTERARALDTERHPTTSFLISTTLIYGIKDGVTAAVAKRIDRLRYRCSLSSRISIEAEFTLLLMRFSVL